MSGAVDGERELVVYPRDCCTCGGRGPVQRVRELEAARDRLVGELKALKAQRQVALQVGDQTLFGSREAVTRARATIEHLKAKAKHAG